MREGEAAPESDRAEGAPHPRETAVLFGQARAERELLDAYRAGRLHHAWLIGGAPGTGKATLAWRFARFLMAHPDPDDDAVRAAADLSVPPDHPAARRVAGGAPGDVAVLRRAWNDKTGKFFSEIRVDEVRRMSGLFQQASRAGGYRICIIDTAEDLNTNSANALLKLIEEPPSRSLFLLLAHHPAQALPTLRSRCRKLALDPLAPADAAAALRALGRPWSETEPAALDEALRRAGGSVSGALPYLGGERLILDRETARLLARLPEVDWAGLHRLADKVGSDEDDFAVLTGAILDWLHGRLGAGATEPRRLAPLAEVWEKVRRSARDTLALNLDKKTFLFSTFADLAQATRAL
ncbi:DNA polymerase III subunit delta' [Lichenibacterium dinghuense]|uniref:DNA polymerase III subunit delta' n=1 Tax=Lichenibacterium dinghuense TaxID=2895977 RepID=UPI001F29DBE5|nr:DNA polymerase III subunit delta' [Lichenibacterium sp. 6Y81]